MCMYTKKYNTYYYATILLLLYYYLTKIIINTVLMFVILYIFYYFIQKYDSASGYFPNSNICHLINSQDNFKIKIKKIYN